MRPDSQSLRRLYIEERKTTREIGSLCGVSKTHVLRWLKAEGIERRAANRGLTNRGIQEPTADDLRRMVQAEHRSYREIAALPLAERVARMRDPAFRARVLAETARFIVERRK